MLYLTVHSMVITLGGMKRTFILVVVLLRAVSCSQQADRDAAVRSLRMPAPQVDVAGQFAADYRQEVAPERPSSRS